MKYSELLVKKLYTKISSGYGKKSYYYSKRFDKWYYCLSNIEKQFIKYCESNYDINYIVKEPFIIQYINEENKVSDYVPDFMVVYHNGRTIIVECKHKKFFKNMSTRDMLKFKHAKEYLTARGADFKFFDGKNLINAF